MRKQAKTLTKTNDGIRIPDGPIGRGGLGDVAKQFDQLILSLRTKNDAIVHDVLVRSAIRRART